MLFSDVVAALGVVELAALAVVLVALVRRSPGVKLGLVLVAPARRSGAGEVSEQRKVA